MGRFPNTEQMAWLSGVLKAGELEGWPVHSLHPDHLDKPERFEYARTMTWLSDNGWLELEDTGEEVLVTPSDYVVDNEENIKEVLAALVS